jgi:hypothetical protein
MSKRAAPDDVDEDIMPPAKIARKLSVDELVTMAMSENDESSLNSILNEAFVNVIETWNVRDWLTFTRATASLSGLRHPGITENYIFVWKKLVERDFHCIIRERSGLGMYKFLRNIQWLWDRKRNHPTKPYPRPSLRDFWRRAYFAANKFLHYLLGAGIGRQLRYVTARPTQDARRFMFPAVEIVPDEFRPWIKTYDELMRERDIINSHLLEGIGMPSMSLGPHSANLSMLRFDDGDHVGRGARASANTTAFTRWMQSRYHAIPVRVATHGLPAPFVIIPIELMEHPMELAWAGDLDHFTRQPKLLLAYTMAGPTTKMVRFEPADGDRTRTIIELSLSNTITDMFEIMGGGERILIGRAVPLAEYHVPALSLPHFIRTSIGLSAIDAESMALSLSRLRPPPRRLKIEFDMPTITDYLMILLGLIENQEERGVSRMHHRDAAFIVVDVESKTRFDGHRTMQLDGWPLFLQFCLTDDPEALRARPRRDPPRGYFSSLTRLFRSPPDEQINFDPFRTRPEPPRGAIVGGSPPFILFDCSICKSTFAMLCDLDAPTTRYCKDCARRAFAQ